MKSIRRFSSKTASFIHQNISGELYSRGVGVFGALGISDDSLLTDRPSFSRVTWPNIDDFPVQIIAGWGHSVVVTTQGNLVLWGRPLDFASLLRINNIYKFSKPMARMVAKSSNSLFGDVVGYYPEPTIVNRINKVKCVSASAGLTVFVDEEGRVGAFGQNNWVQCGIPVQSPDKKSKEMAISLYEPVLLTNIPKCSKVDVGLQHSIALGLDGSVWTWGKASKGQLGHNLNNTRSSTSSKSENDILCALPASISLEAIGNVSNMLIKLKATDIGAGFAHSAAIAEDGSLYVWGKGMASEEKTKAGMIRICEDQWTPRRIVLPGQRLAVSVYCSNFHVVVRADDDSVWAMGMGEHDRNANPSLLPVFCDYSPIRKSEPKTNNTAIFNGKFELKKGYNRVSLHTNELHERLLLDGEDPSFVEANPTLSQSFEIVIHNSEAYLIPLNVELPNIVAGGARILDYSSGWRHELILVSRSLP